jgi:hypothetical protein
MPTSLKRERSVVPIQVGSKTTAAEFLSEMRNNEYKELALRVKLLESDIRRLTERIEGLRFPNRKEAAWSK